MRIKYLHEWCSEPESASALQKTLRRRVEIRPYPGNPRLIAGADCGYDEKTNKIVACVVVFDVKGMKEVARSASVMPVSFPYVPGLLSFREGPALLKAFEDVAIEPDVVLLDGHGIAHPRGFGLACHMGLWLNTATIGVAKSLFVGSHDTPAKGFGSTAILRFESEDVGAVFRAAEGAGPVYVSPGHLTDIKSSLRIVRAACDGKRIPKPTRIADAAVRALVKSGL